MASAASRHLSNQLQSCIIAPRVLPFSHSYPSSYISHFLESRTTKQLSLRLHCAILSPWPSFRHDSSPRPPHNMLALHPQRLERTRPLSHPATICRMSTRGRSRDVSPIALVRASADRHRFPVQISLNLTLQSNLDVPPHSDTRYPYPYSDLSTTPRQTSRNMCTEDDLPVASSSRTGSSPPFR